MTKQVHLTVGGEPVLLDLDAAMSIQPYGSQGTELVFPSPLGRVLVNQGYEEVLRLGDRDAGAFGRAVDGMRSVARAADALESGGKR